MIVTNGGLLFGFFIDGVFIVFSIFLFFKVRKIVNSLDARIAEQVKIRLDYEIGKRRSEEREWMQAEIKRQFAQFIQEQRLKALQKKSKDNA